MYIYVNSFHPFLSLSSYSINTEQTGTTKPSSGHSADVPSASPAVASNAQGMGAHLPPNHYPNELLKIIRDNMQQCKDNQNIWTLLNNIAAPLIVKNVNAATYPIVTANGSPNTLGSSTAPAYSTTNDGACNVDGAETGLKETALLQAMEHNFINNHTGYELLANAILSNGGLLPNYLSDPVLSPFVPPPPLPVSPPNGSHGGSSCDNYAGYIPQMMGSPGHGGHGVGGYQSHPNNLNSHQSLNFGRMPSAAAGEGHHQHSRHLSGPLYFPYNNPTNGCSSNNSSCANYGYNLHPFYYNGHVFYPRPKNFWNFCMNCKKSQFCYQHLDNCNSSAFHGGMPDHYITFPGNQYVPEYYQRPFNYSHYGGHGGGGGYYHPNNHNKRNGRRNYNNNHKHSGNNQASTIVTGKSQVETASTGSSTPSRSSRPSSPRGGGSPTSASQQVSASKSSSSSGGRNGEGKRGGAERKDSVSADTSAALKTTTTSLGSSCSSSNKSGSQVSNGNGSSGGGGGGNGGKGGKKKWQQNGRGHMGGIGGYDSDNSSSRFLGNVPRYNYGLLQNMKLWHTDAAYKREQLLAGELGPQQLLSPTNHRFNTAPPLLITVLETQAGYGGGDGDAGDLTTTTQPVIHEEELDSESAYWSSIFPFSGSLDEVVELIEESTPADKYLANAHQMGMVETPRELIDGPLTSLTSAISSRDVLSQQIWNTFLTVQQTQETYRKKLVIWKLLFACIKVVNKWRFRGSKVLSSNVLWFCRRCSRG